MRTLRAVAVLAMLLMPAAVVGGCDDPPAPSPHTSQPSREVIEAAIAFRTRVGLRSDEAWVVEVERDPSATAEPFGVRLLPSELAELGARSRAPEAVAAVVDSYGQAHPDSYGGSYIDQQRAGLVVALFKGPTEVHEAAIARVVHPDASFVVRSADYSITELEQLQQRVEAASAWFASRDILVGSVALDTKTNRVELVYYSLDGDDTEVIRQHFDAGLALRIILNPDPTAFLPRGSLRGVVIDSTGAPVADVLIRAIGDIGNAEPDGGMAYGTDANGEFWIPQLAAMGWEVQALIGVPDVGYEVVASGRVTVTAGHEAFLALTVP